jgi:hypothetical protein
MKRFTFLILLFPFFSSAQFKNNIWCFGDSAGIDFTSGFPSPISSSIRSRGGVVSIADSLGNLLFYAGGTPDALNAATINGAKIYNKNHLLMQFGDSIVGSAWYREHVIIPKPADNSIFYLFNAGVTPVYGLYYSVIDLSRDSGRGSVVMKNIQLQDSLFIADDGLTGIKHGNGRDWWVITRNAQGTNNTYYFYLVTPDSIFLDHTQNIGDAVPNSNAFRVEPSDDGKKIAAVNSKGFIGVYDFDRCAGILYNEKIIEHDVITMNQDSLPWYWSCTFSPAKRFLYIGKIPISWNNPVGYLYQYDLNDTNPSLSRVIIDTTYGPEVGDWPKLAPDGKIYVACEYEQPTFFPYPFPDSVYNNINMNLGVINYPDSLGSSCNFSPYSFSLGGKRTYGCLPNNLNYELGADFNSICDTALSISETKTTKGKLHVFYHSSWQTAFINASGLQGKNYSLHLINLEGKEIAFETGVLSSEYFTRNLSCNSLSAGVYFVLFETEKETLVERFMAP